MLAPRRALSLRRLDLGAGGWRVESSARPSSGGGQSFSFDRIGRGESLFVRLLQVRNATRARKHSNGRKRSWSWASGLPGVVPTHLTRILNYLLARARVECRRQRKAARQMAEPQILRSTKNGIRTQELLLHVLAVLPNVPNVFRVLHIAFAVEGQLADDRIVGRTADSF